MVKVRDIHNDGISLEDTFSIGGLIVWFHSFNSDFSGMFACIIY